MTKFSMEIFVFDGLGTPTSFSSQTTDIVLINAKLPICQVLLTCCHSAFERDFESLNAEDKIRSGIDQHIFKSPLAFLDVPLVYRTNSIILTLNLYLTQILRFISNVNMSITENSARESNALCDSELLGFSTGILAAIAISASNDIPSLLARAVEAFRLAFWLGFRSRLFATSAISDMRVSDIALPWSLVVFGASRQDIQESVDRCNQENRDGPNVYLTAVTNPTCISVSGRPDAIAKFKSNFLPPNATGSHFVPVYALYHAQELEQVKMDVMQDIERRSIRFPIYEDIKRPVRSSVDGRLFDAVHHGVGSTLVEDIVDMILLYPVNFDLVVDSMRGELAALDRPVKLINIGPGTGLWRSIRRSLEGLQVSTADWSSAATNIEQNPTKEFTPPRSQKQEPIAIVGMAINFPGAKNVDELRNVLEKGLNTVSEIPEDRFNVSKYTQAQPDSGRTLKTKFGNFIDDADAFDNAFFHISPREARSMDPQQRVLLQVAYHALEDAGYVPNVTPTFDPDTFATYVGVATNDYVQNLRNDPDVFYSTGTLQAFLSGKISFAFGFSGPSMVVDTACSSSVVAIHQACRALANGDCRAALAGGVNIISSPDMYMGLDRAHFLSPTGQCRPWDASADGYCRGEGCGMFVLKRLSDALSEKDRILGVIRGVEVNQSGKAESITHPHIETQARLYRKLLASTGIQPHQIGVIEAHGTGTQAGDPTELEGLRMVFAASRSADNPLHITSVKANIGHAEAASGAASLAKLVLMMRKRVIPATISLKHLNLRIPDLSLDHTCIDTVSAPWVSHDGRKRLALLNNFGAAGSNAALILEEPPVQMASGSVTPPRAVMIGLSAESEEAINRLRESYIRVLTDSVHDQATLADFAYTATARRQLYRHRIAAFGKSREQLCESLKNVRVIKVDPSRYQLAFLFSGQGGQYRGMGSGLYNDVPSFRRIVDQCHRMLVSWGFPGILSVFEARDPNTPSLEDIEDLEVSQSAVFVLEHALSKLWIDWGIQPSVVAGHSLGEYAALVCAGVISLKDALWLVAMRAKLMKSKCLSNSTGMLAIRLGSEKVKKILESSRTYEKLSIACYNSGTDCVVAGDIRSLESLQDHTEELGYTCVRLNVPYAYHSFAMEPILDDLRQLGRRIKLSAPSIPIMSTTDGLLVAAGDASVIGSDYFSHHCTAPVRFQTAVQHLLAHEEFQDLYAWLEIGPHPITLPLCRANLDSVRSQASLGIATLRKGTADLEALCSALSKLYHTPISVSWPAVYADIAPCARLVDLPSYPFAQTRYWVPYEENSCSNSARAQSRNGLCSTIPEILSPPPAPSRSDAISFDIDIDQLALLIEGHQVAGYALCPASVYIDMALSATQALFPASKWCSDTGFEVSEVTFENPLIYVPCRNQIVRIELLRQNKDRLIPAAFKISSSSEVSDSPGRLLCSGSVHVRSDYEVMSDLSPSRNLTRRRRNSLQIGSRGTKTFYTHTIYSDIFSRVVNYSDTYRTVQAITIRNDGIDAYAIAEVPSDPCSGRNELHSIFIDTLLHVAGFMLNLKASEDEIFICSQVEQVFTLPELVQSSTMYGIYCHIPVLSNNFAVASVHAMMLDDPEEQIVAGMKKIQFRRFNLSSFRKVLGIQAQDVGLRVVPGLSVPRVDSFVSNFKEQCLDIIAKVCCNDCTDLRMDSQIGELGIDSLMSIELTSRIKRHFPWLHVEARTIKPHTQLGSFIQALEEQATRILSRTMPVSETTSHSNESIYAAGGKIMQEDHKYQVKAIMASVLGIPSEDLRDDEELTLLGLDSLTGIEARHALQCIVGGRISDDIFLSCGTLNSLITVLSKHCAMTSSAPRLDQTIAENKVDSMLNPVLLQGCNFSDTLPLILIHDGSGLIHQYLHLSSLGRRVWGVQNPKITTGEEWKGGVQEMASHYGRLIKDVMDNDSCIIGGWSFGGIVAFEVARQLAAMDICVAGLVLIDSPNPLARCALPDSVIDAVIGARACTSKTAHTLRSQMRYASKALANYEPSMSPVSNASLPRAVMLRSQDAYPMSMECNATSFLANRADPAKSVRGWEILLGATVPVLDIPGNHFEPFDPENVAAVSLKLMEALKMLDP